MTIHHHPSDETIARYAAGQLEAGQALVIAVHVGQCSVCRDRVRDFEAIGGALIEDLPPEKMEPDALARIFARIDAEAPAAELPSARARAERIPRPTAGDIELPAELAGCRIGPWRWLAPGFRMSRVRIPDSPNSNVLLLRIGPNRKMPDHGHTGTELTQVLLGSYSDAQGRYDAGDLTEEDAETEHQPLVAPDSECICLTAIEGRMRLSGIARLFQPLLGL